MSACATCQRSIVGDAADILTCVIDAVAGAMTLCAACFWADSRRLDWTQWKAPVPDDACHGGGSSPTVAEVQP